MPWTAIQIAVRLNECIGKGRPEVQTISVTECTWLARLDDTEHRMILEFEIIY